MGLVNIPEDPQPNMLSPEWGRRRKRQSTGSEKIGYIDTIVETANVGAAVQRVQRLFIKVEPLS